MREIKFRAYQKNNKQIGSWEEIQIMDREGLLSFLDILEDGAFEVMQYTGLKDKNNVEIYEGDIVKCNNNCVGVVVFEDHDCCFNVSGYYSQSDDYPTMAFFEGQPFEVLGNIHENPELMEGEEE